MPRDNSRSDDADRRLILAIDQAESVAYGSDLSNELNDARADGILRYLGDPSRIPAPAERSAVVDRSSFEMIEWIMPSLLRIFTAADEVCKFEPTGPEDEKTAHQESDYINYVLTQRNNWHQVCNDWFKDALMVKGGYCMAYWEKKVQVETEEYEAQTDDSLALLVEDDGVEVVKHSSYVDEKGAEQQAQQYQQQMMQYQQMAQQAQMQAQQTGMPPQLPPPPQQPPPPMLHDVVIRRTNEKGQVCLHVLPPERTKVSERTPDFTLKDCPYFEVWDYATISDLRQMGFKVDDDLNDDYSSSSVSASGPEQARDQYQERTWQSDDGADLDAATKRLRLRMIWIRFDYDEDGIAEMQYVCRVGQAVLHRSECNRIPVAAICPIPLPHRHVGLSIPDIVADLEDIKTAILRQGIDNIFLSNNARTAVTDKVNIDDILNNVPGGMIRVDGTIEGNILPLQVPFIFPQAIQGLEYIDSVRQGRSGVNNYFTGLDANSLNRTASGVAQLTNSAAQRVEMIARLFSVGVEYLFSIVHELILKHGHKQEVVRLRNQWVPVDPSEWKVREDARIVVGLGSGSPEAQMNQLMLIYQLQMQSAPLGLVQPQNVYRTCAEIVKASKLSGPELYFTDPGNKPMPNPGPPPQVQTKQMELQADQQKFVAQTQVDQRASQADMQLEMRKLDQQANTDKYKIDTDAQVRLQIANMTAAAKPSTTVQVDGKEEISRMGQSVDGMVQTLIARESAADEKLAQAITLLAQSIQQQNQIAAADRVAIRGKDGRVERSRLDFNGGNGTVQ